jgi:serine phosphatase RsbU (regulator of sigma subunit)
VRVDERPDGTVSVTNISTRAGALVRVAGANLKSGEHWQGPLPINISVGETRIDIERGGESYEFERASSEESVWRLSMPPAASTRGGIEASLAATLRQQETLSAETLVAWLETLTRVHQSAIDAAGFYNQAARAMVELFEMDYGLVLHRMNGDWNVAARFPASAGPPSRTLLDYVAQQRTTLIERIQQDTSAASLAGVEAVIASPIVDENGHVAAALYGARFRQNGTPRDVIQPIEARLVQLLSTAVSNGIAQLEGRARLERWQTELDLARQIQAGLLPRDMPAVGQYEFAGHSTAAHFVAGDYYDLLEWPDGRLALVVADVCGDGLPASLLMTTLRAALRALAGHESDPAQLATALNHTLRADVQRRFITMMLGVLDCPTHEFSFVNAGHGPATFHVRWADRHVRDLHEDDCRRTPLGMVAHMAYPRGLPVRMEPGDLLVLGSDGIVTVNESFGAAELKRWLLEQGHLPIQELADRIIEAPLKAAGRIRTEDDATVLVARRRPHGPAE